MEMKRYKYFILCLILAMSSCDYEIREKEEPPKPKLTKEQIRKQEYEQRLKYYDVEFLFECNGVKVYQFENHGAYYYFTNANGRTYYEYTKRISKYTRKTINVQSLNTKK